MTLRIPKTIFDQMVDHCRSGLPNEACGFLGGRDGAATDIYPLTNAAASPVFYKPVDKEMIAALGDIESKGLELISIFHSHVASAPSPSVTDIREAHYPDAVYIIVSFSDLDFPETRGYLIRKQDWRDDAGDVVDVDLVVSSE